MNEHTETQLTIQNTMVEICGKNVHAIEFWMGLNDAVMTWDHIVDEEEINKTWADRGFKFLLIDAPMNPFFTQYRDSLVPVILNAVSAWEFSNEDGAPKIKAYDIYTEVACTMAYILGGRQMVDKYVPEIRRLQWQNCQEDDLADGGKK